MRKNIDKSSSLSKKSKPESNLKIIKGFNNITYYWYITENMIQTINDKEGIIIWNIPEDLRKNIKYHSEGIFQFGIWWIDCDSFTIRNINIITS